MVSSGLWFLVFGCDCLIASRSINHKSEPETRNQKLETRHSEG